MYEKELIPQVIAIGLSYDDFWRLTPRKLNVILEGYKLRRRVQDESQWLLGGYVFQAVSVALGNAFRKKNTKAESYFDLVEKPFLSNINEQEITEDEKQKYIDSFVASLHVMQTNFEVNHGK